MYFTHCLFACAIVNIVSIPDCSESESKNVMPVEFSSSNEIAYINNHTSILHMWKNVLYGRVANPG
jgi:hypothetical protein